jgi:hypothetical protein
MSLFHGGALLYLHALMKPYCEYSSCYLSVRSLIIGVIAVDFLLDAVC